jgi:hypothetical protein
MNLAGKHKHGSIERQAGSGNEVGRHLHRRQEARRNRQVGRGMKQCSKAEVQPCRCHRQQTDR